MTEEEAPITPIYYISPTNKIHSCQCRHYKADKPGWQKMDSYTNAVAIGATPCRICCPKISKVDDKPLEPKEILENQDTITPNQQDFSAEQVSKEEQPKSSTPIKEDGKTSEDKDEKTKSKNKNKKTPVKGYKILAGNGCHQAIAEVQGILVPPIDSESYHQLILPDGLALEATFKDAKLKWLVSINPDVLGAHWFRGYPKIKNDKLVAFQIIGWDGNMPTNEKGWERWEFIGVWTLQKNLTVQRSMGEQEIRKQARETGFIKKFKFTFTNTHDWIEQKKLWTGYVYRLICCREGNTLKIEKVIPYACPRKKPAPKGQPFNKDKSSQKTSPKSNKPEEAPKIDTPTEEKKEN